MSTTPSAHDCLGGDCDLDQIFVEKPFWWLTKAKPTATTASGRYSITCFTDLSNRSTMSANRLSSFKVSSHCIVSLQECIIGVSSSKERLFLCCALLHLVDTQFSGEHPTRRRIELKIVESDRCYDTSFLRTMPDL